VSTAPASSQGSCYRHPERQSYILCQRCGRTICPECQIQAAVGVQCPNCVREGHAETRRAGPSLLMRLRRSGTTSQPVVTYSLIAICVSVWLLQIIPGSPATQLLAYNPQFTASEPWRMITSIFTHSTGSLFHLLFNMYTLFLFGRLLEAILGRWRYLALYLISGLGGSVAVLLLAPFTWVVGASGAIFGLLGAFVVIQRKLGMKNPQLIILIAINLAIGFVPGFSISWQAHVGGLITGAAVAFAYLRTRRADQKNTQLILIGLIVGTLVMITAASVFIG
jgi:membrane associated rhomboid family serine protease